MVLLTFLYANCPDVCPLTASKLRDAHEAMGDASREVSILVVSVDPERDTQEEALAFSQRWDMAGVWDYLVGDRETLSAIWSAYFVAATVEEEGAPTSSVLASGETGTSVEALRESLGREYLISHAAPVYLIDREGIMRVLFTLPFEAAALAHDVKLLLKSG